MKILYLHQYFATPEMPGGTRSYELARRFVAAGHEVRMVTSDQSGRTPTGRWRVSEEAGIEVHWVGNPYDNGMSFSRRIGAFLRFAGHSARRAASLPADLVLATSTPLTIALPGVWAARRHGVPMVFEVRDLWPELPIAMGALDNPLKRQAARWLERFAYGHAAHVVALSPGMREGVIRAGTPAERVSVIPNSCDLELFSPDPRRGRALRSELPWLGDRPLVVYTGTLGRINGVGYLPRLAKAMLALDPEIRFWVVGAGYERPRVEALARELGVLDRNFFLSDSLPKQRMPEVLAAADVACSLFIDCKPMWANSANKFFDALASGTPVALNYGGWQKDLVESRGCGLALPIGDPEAGAPLLRDALRRRGWKEEAGRRARELGRSQFSRDDLARRYGRILEAVAAGREAAPEAPPCLQGA